MNQPPVFSVIIPTFNRANFLRQAIQSALDQNMPAEVIVVVDDQSTNYPGETDYCFGRERTEGAHALLAVAE